MFESERKPENHPQILPIAEIELHQLIGRRGAPAEAPRVGSTSVSKLHRFSNAWNITQVKRVHDFGFNLPWEDVKICQTLCRSHSVKKIDILVSLYFWMSRYVKLSKSHCEAKAKPRAKSLPRGGTSGGATAAPARAQQLGCRVWFWWQPLGHFGKLSTSQKEITFFKWSPPWHIILTSYHLEAYVYIFIGCMYVCNVCM